MSHFERLKNLISSTETAASQRQFLDLQLQRQNYERMWHEASATHQAVLNSYDLLRRAWGVNPVSILKELSKTMKEDAKDNGTDLDFAIMSWPHINIHEYAGLRRPYGDDHHRLFEAIVKGDGRAVDQLTRSDRSPKEKSPKYGKTYQVFLKQVTFKGLIHSEWVYDDDGGSNHRVFVRIQVNPYGVGVNYSQVRSKRELIAALEAACINHIQGG